jgi:hypothetical protein
MSPPPQFGNECATPIAWADPDDRADDLTIVNLRRGGAAAERQELDDPAIIERSERTRLCRSS